MTQTVKMNELFSPAALASQVHSDPHKYINFRYVTSGYIFDAQVFHLK